MQKSAFITALGKRPYRRLKDFLLPLILDDRSFDDLVRVSKEGHAPCTQVIADAFEFNRRQQLEAEPVSALAVKQLHMAAKFTFGTFLEDALLDKSVAGLRNPEIQATLLRKKKRAEL